jgi:pimeloyl-ACP methyl ester carboxylesterase
VPRADCDTLRSVLPNVQLTVYEGVGHAVHWEQPARAADDLREFVDALDAHGAAVRSAVAAAGRH